MNELEQKPMPYKLIVFDLDGTLVTTKSGATFRKGAYDWKWLPGRVEKLQELSVQGIWLAIATNQGGVAFGYMKQDAIEQEIKRTCREGHITDYRVCYNHPQASIPEYCKEDENRKPGPGMILGLVKQFQDVTLDDTLYVGDRPEDEQAAKNAGVAFMWAQDFF